ncbi:NepR family anti-sigma factor [Chelatococcus asaccharovorans]|uniref:Anti-sigma factor NepR domain-containing protein n=1 Tax=Chelatococcus asaccharovorans TaxID=28210 RepID=A0A2V3TY82_9HYPH|nr:NepR family anti-sigma factor [Chelatococcus asaccharovorans]PXW54528.1 hypothetical protein C7450_11159 [Chelatococcus asaccharovorans]
MGARRSADEDAQELHPGDHLNGGPQHDDIAPGIECGVRLQHSSILPDRMRGPISPVPQGAYAHFAERLSALYQTTLEQPVPDRFLELLDKLDRREGQG